jgi:hypothetical protein
VSRRCPTCLRPVFAATPTEPKPDPLKHCPRALIEPLRPDSQQHYTVACLAVGLCARDAANEKLTDELARERELVAALRREILELGEAKNGHG